MGRGDVQTKVHTMATKKKMTLYLPEDLVAQTKTEAGRQERSLSWIMELAWKIARERIQEMPAIEELAPALSE